MMLFKLENCTKMYMNKKQKKEPFVGTSTSFMTTTSAFSSTSTLGMSMDQNPQTRVGAMTTSTNSITTTRPVVSINLHDPKTFKGSILSPDQMRERFRILSEQEQKLAEEGKKLSDQDQRELEGLVTLTERELVEILDGHAPFPIYRLTACHYSVQFGVHKLEVYREIQSRIDKFPQTGVQILQAIQPTGQENWFHNAIVEHAQDVFSSGFMGALRATLVANMCVLRASVLLVGEPKLFREVLTLYSNSNNLYNTQISYNRQVELGLITSAKASYLELKSLHGRIVELCGANLVDSVALSQAAHDFRVAEAQASLKANTEIEGYCQGFLTEIEGLEKEVVTCINNISGRHEKVVAALAEVRAILLQQQRLNDKQREIQADFETFQQTRAMEINSRRQVVHSSTQTHGRSSGCLWWKRRSLFSVTTYRTEIVEDDFGSKAHHVRYLEARSEGDRLAKSLEEARDRLAASMVASGLMQYGQDQNSLQTAASALSTAMMCIGELKVALLQRKNQAIDQKRTCQALISSPQEDSLRTVTAVLNLLDTSIERTLRKQALWLGSSRQTFTLQKCQELEQQVRIQVITALSNSASDPSAIVSVVRALEYRFPAGNGREEGDRSVEAQLPSYAEMLERLVPRQLTMAAAPRITESKEV